MQTLFALIFFIIQKKMRNIGLYKIIGKKENYQANRNTCDVTWLKI